MKLKYAIFVARTLPVRQSYIKLRFQKKRFDWTAGHVTAAEKTKFSHVVAMLDLATAEQVLDILVDPPGSPIPPSGNV